MQLPGIGYFYLDEVEVYPTGSDRNIAVGKPALQSSTSDWSTHHRVKVLPPAAAGPKVPVPAHPFDTVIERGRRLAESQRRLGAKVDAEVRILDQVAQQVRQLPKEAPAGVQRDLYFQARWAVRRMALNNPLLNFDTILFVKRVPGSYHHMSDQHYGWWSRPGGGVCVLTAFKTDQARVRCLTADLPAGSCQGPDLSYDGKKVVFAYCRHYPAVSGMANKVDKEKLPEDSFYHVFEMNVDGSSRRQITRGRYDDFDPRYLPNGEIVFLSTRKGQFLQCSKPATASTARAALPDSYVRCGGDNGRPVAVFTLHAMDAQGGNLRPLSAFENFEWTPSVAADGRILYARWDYIDRGNGPFISLWSANQDGTRPQLVYGQYTYRPQCVFEARSIPNSQKLVFTASAHHAVTGGSLVLLDRRLGTEDFGPLVRLTPDVPFPETEGPGEHHYANPYPLSEEYFLVGWADRGIQQGPPERAMAVYLFDVFGNQELLYRDPTITSQFPLPVAPRPRPPVQSSAVAWDGPQEGRFLLQDVYRGLDKIPAGTVKRLRVIGVPPKTQPQMNSPAIGISGEDPGKFVLGTVPVEDDGSAYFRVPSGVAVFFQALDARGAVVQTMRTLTYVMPAETQSCIGCHESREAAPAVGSVPLAVRRSPSRPTLDPSGTWPLRFDELVQPVLDRQCVSCHRAGGADAKAARLDLTPAKAYSSLLGCGNLRGLAGERDRSIVGQGVALNSTLLALLSKPGGHEGVRLSPPDLYRLTVWMDVYAHHVGSFSPQQEQDLRKMRQAWAALWFSPAQ
jgi:hypothetical protein